MLYSYKYYLADFEERLIMKTTYIHSFQEYLEYTESYKNQAYFRGQANVEWDIIPSLFRETCSLTLSDEQRLVKEEMESSNSDALSALFKLQHYGTPTRICDLTISPFSALFFATQDETQLGSDGVVLIFDKASQISINGNEVNVLKTILEANAANIDFNANGCSEIEKVITSNHIIQYDYKFSYTNPRAILQGGTGLVFGFSFSDGIIGQRTTKGISEYISEQIIIPATVKSEIIGSLYELGYSSDILYNSFENITDNIPVEITETSRDKYDKNAFVKYVAKCKINSLYFDRDEFISNVSTLYRTLFARYGGNARIWLFFYFDDNDISQANWICRTEWNKEQPYTINWTKHYYQTRLSYMNEQASPKEIFERFSALLTKIIPIYIEIHRTVNNDIECLFEVMATIKRCKSEISQISSIAQNIPFGDPDTEKIARLALNFICNVDWLVCDMIIFDNRGDLNTEKGKKTDYYLLKSLYIEKCEKSKNKLELFYRHISTLH